MPRRRRKPKVSIKNRLVNGSIKFTWTSDGWLAVVAKPIPRSTLWALSKRGKKRGMKFYNLYSKDPREPKYFTVPFSDEERKNVASGLDPHGLPFGRRKKK